MNAAASHAVTVFTVFTPQSAGHSEFVDVQAALLPTLRDRVPGLLGSRCYASIDNRTAVLMSIWEKFSHFEQFRGSEAFAMLLRGSRPAPLCSSTES